MDHTHETTTSDPHSDMGSEMDMGGHSMAMTFHGGYKDAILFDVWQSNTVGGFIGSLIGIFLLTMLYEALKVYREKVFYAMAQREQFCSKNLTPEAGSQQSIVTQQNSLQYNMLSKPHLVQTAFHALQFILSYCLMLVFMTYNSWICLSMVLGSTAGYFVFGFKRSYPVNTSCCS